MEYIRLARYFDRDSGEPNDDGKRLLDSLGPINVHSLSDIKSDKRPDAEKAIRDWLRKPKADNGLSEDQIKANAAKVVDNLVEKAKESSDGWVDWVSECGGLLPMHNFNDMMGVPESERVAAARAGDAVIGRVDPMFGDPADPLCALQRVRRISFRVLIVPTQEIQQGRVQRHEKHLGVSAAFKMTGAILRDLHNLWLARAEQDEYVGTLVNAWIAAGGRARGVRAGASYVDVGTVRGYREAIALLSERPAAADDAQVSVEAGS